MLTVAIEFAWLCYRFVICFRLIIFVVYLFFFNFVFVGEMSPKSFIDIFKVFEIVTLWYVAFE